MTKYSDPNDGITMTEWEFKEYVEAWVEKSLMIKQQKEKDDSRPD
jgi:heme-degrading monooxygenase HmoA